MAAKCRKARALSSVMERVGSCGDTTLRLEFFVCWSMVSVTSEVEVELITTVACGGEAARDGGGGGGEEEEGGGGGGGGEDQDEVEEN